MIGIHLVSHGELCTGMLDSLKMIIGETPQIDYTMLSEDTDIDEYKVEMLATSRQLDQGSGVLVLADMYGATPYNIALLNSQEFDRQRYQIIAGFNLPILIEAVLNRENVAITELVLHLNNSLKESFVISTELN